MKSGKSRILGLGSILLFILIGSTIVLISLGVGYWFGSTSASEWQDRYNEFRREAERVSQVADSLSNEADRYKSIADSISSEADEISKRLEDQRRESVALREENKELTDKVLQQLDSLPSEVADQFVVLINRLNEEIEGNLREIAFLHERDDLRLLEIESLRQSLSLQTSRADSLQMVVDNIPPPQEPRKLLGFLTISRTNAALAGTVVGVVIGAIVIP